LTEKTSHNNEKYSLEPKHLQNLVETLIKQGYTVAGPTVRDKTLVFDLISSADELPVGWTTVQDSGSYRLTKRSDKAVFGYTVGQASIKNFLHPSLVDLWSAKKKGKGFILTPGNGESLKYAFLGIRPCELAAMTRHDKIFIEGDYQDPIYKKNRENALFIVVNCAEPSGTCFCASMDTGPEARGGYDIALTEVLAGDKHYFVADAGSDRGAEILKKVPHGKAGESEVDAAKKRLLEAAGMMGRTLDTTGLKEMLYRSYEHQQWNDVADRCLSCGNCTMVCPTCFCNTLMDSTDLSGENVTRRRRWDSCYSVDYTYIHGGSTRPKPRSRYRQWLTHKLATWEDQFGMSGCVGCGRCITWCPAGIDITEEVRSLRGQEVVCKTCVPSREKSFEAMKRMLVDFPLVVEIGEKYIDLITQNASIVRFNPGETIVQAGDDADRFFLIRHGEVAIETYAPERGPIVVQTIGEGEMIGWSWFLPPYKWHFDARAVQLTRAISVLAQPIRDLCEEDNELGYRVNRYISQIIGQRMEATRMQLLDVFHE